MPAHRLTPLVAATCALAVLGACGPAEVATRAVPLNNHLRIQAEEAMRDEIAEPMSSFYRMSAAYVTPQGAYAVCGEVNAKTRAGGYAGFTPFYVLFEIRGSRVRTKSVLLDPFTAPAACDELERRAG